MSAFRDRLRARRRLRPLASAPDPRAGELHTALQAVLRGRFDRGERAWMDRIERQRERLAASEDPIEIPDYEAGPTAGPSSQAALASPRVERKTVGEMCVLSSKDRDWGPVLLELVLALRPESCLELGTCVGVSAAYQAAGLELSGGAGTLVTMEGAPSLAAVAERSLGDLGLAGRVDVVVGRFVDNLADVLEERGPFDLAFIDGHHDEAATLEYFEQIAPSVRDGGVIVFDDISWSDGMKRAWRRLAADERLPVSADLGPVGVCVYRPGGGEPVRVVAPYGGALAG